MREHAVILRIVAVALLLYAMAGWVSVHGRLRSVQQLQQQLAGELTALRAEQDALAQQILDFGTASELRRLAWERLGMVLPGETVYYFVDPGA